MARRRAVLPVPVVTGALVAYQGSDQRAIPDSASTGEYLSEASEYGAILSPDGRYLFFTSSRTGRGDIYWVSADVLRPGT